MNKSTKSKNGNANWVNLIFGEDAPIPSGKELTSEQQKAFHAIKTKAREFAQTVAENSPEGTGQTICLRLIREAYFTAGVSVGVQGLM